MVLPVAIEDRLVREKISALLQRDSADDLVRMIRAVAAAETAQRRRYRNGGDAVHMTPREREVVDLIAAGMSNREISNTLGIALYTVSNHVRNVMNKLMLHTRLQIAVFVHCESVL